MFYDTIWAYIGGFMKIKLKNTKLLFLYRSILFKNVKFYTDNNKLRNIVNALNIKNKKNRIMYVYDEAIKEINNYYREDLCKFIDGKCIVQRLNNSNHVDGCCYKCPIVTDKGCPSSNFACKLIYCKTAIGNMKRLNFNKVYILKCLSISQRLVILTDFFSTREEIIEDTNKGILRTIFKYLFKRKYVI